MWIRHLAHQWVRDFLVLTYMIARPFGSSGWWMLRRNLQWISSKALVSNSLRSQWGMTAFGKASLWCIKLFAGVSLDTLNHELRSSKVRSFEVRSSEVRTFDTECRVGSASDSVTRLIAARWALANSRILESNARSRRVNTILQNP